MNQIALIEKTRSLIAAGDISGAEAALADLADTEGDGALMVVLEQLQPKDILAVIREYDNSKDSVINLLVTPAQFARAVVIEKQYKDLTRTHLRGMMNAVIFREDADPIEFLTAIGDLEGGSEALADYFSACQALRHQHLPTLPSNLTLERQINPFLRSRLPALVRAAHAFDAQAIDEVSVFAALRQWKNQF